MANTAWNPSDKTAGITLSGSNLIATSAGTGNSVRAVDKQATGKFYFELTPGGTVSVSSFIGLAGTGYTIGSNTSTYSVSVNFNGTIFVNNLSTSVQLGTIATGSNVGFAVDFDARVIWIRPTSAGNWNGNAAYSPTNGIGGISFLAAASIAAPLYPFCWFNNAMSVTANFGDTAFAGSVPSGYTSGFTAGATPALAAVVTQVGAEHWITTDPILQVTQVALEEWGVGSPDAQVTQVAIEEWGSVEATYSVPVTPAFMLAGSRAGIGSAVLVQDNADRTVMLAGIGALQQGAQTVTTPSAGDAVRAIIMA